MVLTIDAGNTRTKWALFNNASEITWQGVCHNSEIASAVFLPQNTVCKKAIIANVAGPEHAALLLKQLQQANVHALVWAKASAQACEVLNQYDNPELLGIDRWAAIVAAWHMVQGVCVVVNAGTAVTVDGLGLNAKLSPAQGIFHGGVILPGLELMQHALGNRAALLPTVQMSEHALKRDIFAKNTENAIHAGSIHAINGAITLMYHHLNSLYKCRPKVIISGGNAKLLKENLIADVTRQTLIVDNLVLHGLNLLENNP